MCAGANANYRSFFEQSVHYFDRPHLLVPQGPVGGAAAWRGPDLAPGDYTHVLTDAETAELDAARTFALATGKPLVDLSVADFPLPTLSSSLRAWSEQVANGTGVVVIRGLPVDEWREDDSSLVFWCLGLHLGVPGAQNTADDLLGHVIDLEPAPSPGSTNESYDTRLYRTNAFIAFHCDAADSVGLLCLNTAKEGGASRIASSVAVLDELRRTEPELADRLFEPFELDLRGDGSTTKHIPITPSRYDGQTLRTFFHSDYFRSVVRHDDIEPLSDLDLRTLDEFERLAGSPAFRLDMAFQAGDIQLINNHTVVHSRAGYTDDPANPRHLLRLWLSFER